MTDNNEWTISLWSEWQNKSVGIVLHEMLHALGFYHEQSRKDRDQFVEVIGKSNNYRIQHSSQELTKFDCFSIMLYEENDLMRRTDNKVWNAKPDHFKAK